MYMLRVICLVRRKRTFEEIVLYDFLFRVIFWISVFASDGVGVAHMFRRFPCVCHLSRRQMPSVVLNVKSVW